MPNEQEYRTNQGQDFSTILDDVPHGVLADMSRVAKEEYSHHPPTSTCECPVIEALATLYSQGFKVVKC